MADTTEKTVAEELRAAAETQRAGAAQARKSMAALPGPAYPTVDAFQVALGQQFPVSRGMCEHIARWTPEAAEALASWLETEAHMWEQRGNSADGHTFHALAVARALSGTTERTGS